MDAIDLSRRGFFGATSAALVAMIAPRRAYSFLTANPLAAGTWNGVAFTEPNVMVITSAEQARKMFGDGRCDHFFTPPKLIAIQFGFRLDGEVPAK